MLHDRLTIFTKQIPMLNILDPTTDEESFINFKYYNIKDLNNLLVKQDNILSVFHTNIRSYNKNFSELSAILTSFSESFDIIGLSETWDTEESGIKPQSLPGYHPLERWKGSSQNGGVILYVKKKLTFNNRNDLSGKLRHSESLFIEIENDKKI